MPAKELDECVLCDKFHWFVPFRKGLHIPEEVRRVTAEKEVNLYLTTQKDTQQLKLQDGKQRDNTMTQITYDLIASPLGSGVKSL